ncbi:MAG: hypothetical protein OSJ83_00645 [Clostridia bacterium]|nr:hypothetical protein [Clostridia bacterium]
MAKKRKHYDDDDGRTIVDMNVDGMPWYQPNRDKNKKVDDEDRPTRKERFAMIRAWFAAYAPRIFAVFVGFGLTIGLLVCWLNGWFIK